MAAMTKEDAARRRKLIRAAGVKPERGEARALALTP
jgi:hypothetical protein